MINKTSFMKKAIAILASSAMLVCFAGCGMESPYSGLDMSKYVKVGKYTGIEYEKATVEKVTADDVQSQIQSDLSSAAQTKFYSSDETVQDGDKVNMDYTGTINGEEFDGGSATGYTLEIGSGSFIDGFEDALIGKEAGKTCTFYATFPKDYSESSLAGKKAKWTVKVNNIIRSETPDEKTYASDNGYSSVKAYEKQVKKDLVKNAKETAKNSERSSAWENVLEKCKAKKYPKGLVSTYTKASKANLTQTAEQYGIDFDTMISYYGYSSESDWTKAEKTNSKDQIKSEMVAYVIASDENLMPSSGDIKDKIEEYTEDGTDEDSFEETYGYTLKQYITTELIYENAADYVIEKGKAKTEKKSTESSTKKSSSK